MAGAQPQPAGFEIGVDEVEPRIGGELAQPDGCGEVQGRLRGLSPVRQAGADRAQRQGRARRRDRPAGHAGAGAVVHPGLAIRA
jgi:hypothetical protein